MVDKFVVWGVCIENIQAYVFFFSMVLIQGDPGMMLLHQRSAIAR